MKKIIIIFSCACTLCAFGALAYFIFVHRSVVDYLTLAQTARRDGDIKTAEENFLEVIRRDKVNETAYIALAEIAEKNKKLAWAASYWGTAARLNPLSKRLREKYIKALLEIYQDAVVVKQLGRKKVTSLSDFELYALTKASRSQNPRNETKKLLALLLKRSPKDSKVILLHANILLACRKPEEAGKLFTSLVNCKDKEIRTSALIGLGNIDLIFKKTKEAGVNYKKAAESTPDSLQALMTFADYNLTYGKTKLAESQYQKLHKRFPKNLIITIKLAEIYAGKKNVLAIKKLLSHINVNNQTVVAAKYYLRAMLAYIANDPKKLKENLGFCKVFRLRPLYVYLQFPEILASNDISSIRRHVAVLLRINDSTIAKTDLCSRIERLAMENFKKNEFKKSAALAMIMQEMLPEKPELTHLAMVSAYYQQQWKKAVVEADKFNKIRPDSLDYLSIKGRSLLYLNEAKKALPLLKKLTVLTPKNPETWFWIAQASQLLNRQGDVDAYVGKMLRLSKGSHAIIDPAVIFFTTQKNMKIADKIAKYLQSSNNKTFDAMAWSIKAQVAQKNKKWQEAVKYLLKAYELGKNTDMLLYIVDIYLEQGKYDKALEYITIVLKDKPNDPKAVFRQAVIAQELKDYEQAIKLYEKLLKKYPQWSIVLVNLSDIMAIKGKTRKALNFAQRAQEKAPHWLRAKHCLALRELDSENYTAALRDFNLLLRQYPTNKSLKASISRCLVPIIRKSIENRSFEIAKYRLKQLIKVTPDSKEIAILEKLLTAKEKTNNISSEKKLL